jgi:tetratricopeptide (TPR) repeat protein
LLVGWLWFIGTLVPVIGLVQVGGQAMADRYTYIPIIGLFIMVAWGGADLIERLPAKRAITTAFFLVLCPLLAYGTWLQTGHWRNSIVLFENALAVTENNLPAHNNLGEALAEQGRFNEAVEHYLMALQINPEDDTVLVNLGSARFELGDTLEALNNYSKAVEINPDSEKTHNNLGLTFEKIGRREVAIEHYMRAIEINPEFAKAHHNLGVSLFRNRQMELAVEHLRKAVELDPGYDIARQNLEKTLSILEQQSNRNQTPRDQNPNP